MGCAINKKTILLSLVFLVILSAGIVLSYVSKTILFDTFPWLLIVSVLFGIALGVINARKKRDSIISDGLVARHDGTGFFQHWGTALGIFILIVSGILMGFLFIPHILDTIAGFTFASNMHFIGLVVALFGGFYFLTSYLLTGKLRKMIPGVKDFTQGTFGKYVLRKKWISEDKYLSSQKSSFLLFAFLGGIQLVTGIIKVVAHIWAISAGTMAIVTAIHDVFSLLFILFLIAHVLFVVLIKKHRILLGSWFNGKVTEDYVREEHPVWYETLKK